VSFAPVAVLRDDVLSHPATLVWADVVSDGGRPSRIEVLRERTPTAAVYRLVGAGPGGTDVIAKYHPAGQGEAERFVYEHLLPQIPLSTPRCYGVRRVEAGQGKPAFWLLLEDVGTERYSDRNPDHLALVARWVAALHRHAAELEAARGLPDAGPARYRLQLIAARARLGDRLLRGGLAMDDRRVLADIIQRLGRLEERWDELAASCTGLPPTLVHGDFRPKNVYIRSDAGALVCFPIDWETAGWGVPAADLTRIDVVAYWGLARTWHSGLNPDRVRRLAELGQVFRTIAAIEWESTGLVFEAPAMISRPLASLRVLLHRLREVLSTMGFDR
jgi:hypothetical protein